MSDNYVSGNNGNRGGNKLEWILVKDFVDEEHDIILRVKGTTTTFRPRYSMQIGRLIREKTEDGTLGEPLMEKMRDGRMVYMMAPHLGILVQGQGQLTLDPLTEGQPMAIAKLMNEVQFYMLHKYIQPREDEIIVEKAEKEKRDAEKQYAGTSAERERKKGGKKKGIPRSKVVAEETANAEQTDD